MNTPLSYDPQLERFTKNWLWYFLGGLALIVLGTLAISFSVFTTIISVVFIAAIILGTGLVIAIDSFATLWGRWRSFALHLIMGLFYILAGFVLMVSPIAATVSLTLFLAVIYIFIGGFRMTYAISTHLPHWGWTFFSGVLALLLGLLILVEWPASSLFIIGLFVGIDLMILGWVYVLAAITARGR